MFDMCRVGCVFCGLCSWFVVCCVVCGVCRVLLRVVCCFFVAFVGCRVLCVRRAVLLVI